MNTTNETIVPKKLKTPEYGCLSEKAGISLAHKVDKMNEDSNPFSVILPALASNARSWSEKIQSAHDSQTRKKHVDIGQPVVQGFFKALNISGIEEVLEYCRNHEPPLIVGEENLNTEEPTHNALIQHLDAVPINSVVVTFSVKQD